MNEMPTPDEIMNMNADELRMAILKHIGWIYHAHNFEPAKNMFDAWRIVEKMREHICLNPYIWEAFIEALGFESMRELMADIGPSRICRAALIAIQSASPTHDLP